MTTPTHTIDLRNVDFELGDYNIELFDVTQPDNAVWVATKAEALAWIERCWQAQVDDFYPRSLIAAIKAL